MATDDSLKWQKQHMVDSDKALDHDLRAAAEEALSLGRPLTDDEFSAFRLDRYSSATPIRRLVYKGTELVAI